MKKKFPKTLILVFEVIVQPPKTHFLTFSSETKIMKITHSASQIKGQSFQSSIYCVLEALCVIFMILVSLENVKKYSHVVARLPQRLKSTLFEIFSHSGYPSGTLRSKKFQTTLILAFEANSALSHKNETKIVKITHSARIIGSCNCSIYRPKLQL